MSWFARSIENSLKFDEDDEGDVDPDQKPEDEHTESPESLNTEDSSPTTPSRGVKEDLSEFRKTLTRQFWGVASLLVPPPQPEQKSDADAPESEEEDPMLGIRGDFAEIGGNFRSGISRLSNNINVSEITKMASNLLQLESDDESEESGKRISLGSLGKEAVGVTEGVVAFTRDISMHPETWLDFPLPEIVGDGAGFDMSDAQQGHALAVERFVPSLAALRLELCPTYMSESNFWKIYFVLLHPRLDKEDAELLLTPQIVEARSLLAHELKNRKTTELEDSIGKKSSDSEDNSVSSHIESLSAPPPASSTNNLGNQTVLNGNSSTAKATSETVIHPKEINEIQIEDKAIVVEKDADQDQDKQLKSGEVNTFGDKDEDEDEADDWLKEETPEIGGPAGKAIAIENNDDVSFSDLEEEEDDGDASNSLRKSSDSSDKESRDWVRLGKSSSKSSKGNQESKESNDWLDIDDDDDDIVVT